MARLGRRRAAQDLVAAHREAITAGEADLDRVRAEASPAKTRFDELDRRSKALHGQVREANDLDRDDRYELYQLDYVLEAVKTVVDRTTDRQGSPTELTDAFHSLEPLVRHTPSVSAREGEIDRGQWNELLGPGVIWLREHGIEPDPSRLGGQLARCTPSAQECTARGDSNACSTVSIPTRPPLQVLGHGVLLL